MLGDLSVWARGDGLEIVMMISGAVLVVRFAQWAVNRYVSTLDVQLASAGGRDDIQRAERIKHVHAGVEASQWVFVVFVWFVVTLMVLDRIGVPFSGLVAPATVVGVALGFGAQRVVQDLLSGFMVIVERQYGFGDQILISTPGSTTGVSGTVEDVTLRATRLRTLNGELLIVPNGEVRQVTNLSREWARALVDVPIPAAEDVTEASAVLRAVAEDAMADADLRSLLLDPPTVMGVEKFDPGYVTVRMVARTLPGRQFEVGRRLRADIVRALRDRGIELAGVAA
jgi:small conductance mechanosensitive channel